MTQHAPGVGEFAGNRRAADAFGEAVERVLTPKRYVEIAERLQAVFVFEPGEGIGKCGARRPVDALAVREQGVDGVGQDRAAARLR